MFDGKAFGEEIVAAVKQHVSGALAPLLARLDAAEKRLGEVCCDLDALNPQVEAVGAAIGEEIATHVAENIAGVKSDVETLQRFVAALSDAEAADERLAAAVAKHFEANPPPNVEPMLADMVKTAIAALPAPADGKDGAPGRDGADVTDERLAEAVAKHLEANPPPAGADGKDGAPGRDGKDGVDGKDGAAGADGRDGVDGKDGTIGERGEKGAPGDPGRDGVGLAGAIIDRSGELVLTLTDGSTRHLGVVIGKDGAPGRDGLGFEDFDFEYDGERSFIARWSRGETVKEFAFSMPVILDRGVYKAGEAYQKGDAVSWGGSLWIAQRDTGEKPEATDAWRLSAKRGRDGKDAPVKVGA